MSYIPSNLSNIVMNPKSSASPVVIVGIIFTYREKWKQRQPATRPLIICIGKRPNKSLLRFLTHLCFLCGWSLVLEIISTASCSSIVIIYFAYGLSVLLPERIVIIVKIFLARGSGKCQFSSN